MPTLLHIVSHSIGSLLPSSVPFEMNVYYYWSLFSFSLSNDSSNELGEEGLVVDRGTEYKDREGID